MFFLKKEDRPGPLPPPTPRYSARWTWLHRLGGLNPLGNSRGFRSWRVLGPILTLSWLILAFKTPTRASKTPPRRPQDPPRRPQEPPRRSKMPPRHSCGRPKNIDAPCVFQGFRCPGPAWRYLGPTCPPRRLQEPLERVPRLPRRLQESLRRLQRPPRHPQEPPRCSQDTSPRSPKIENFIMLFNLLAFLGLLGGSSLNMVVKTLPRCLQEPPKCA